MVRATEEQKDCRGEASALKPGDHLKINAFAGAGKTTTLKLIAEVMPGKGCYLAFNKAIADEAKVKLAMTRCTASSMHSLAFRAMSGIIDRPANLNAKTFRETGIMDRFRLRKVAGWNDFRLALSVCRVISTFCNSADTEVLPEHARMALIAAVGDPDMIRNEELREKAQAAIDAYVNPLCEMSRIWMKNLMDRQEYSHDMYLKAIDLDAGLRREAFRGFRYLMVDEAQDLNPVQRSILMKTGLSLIAVGDPYQQIYSWRGAENALALLPGKSLYLTQSFRFGEEIADYGRRILASRPDGGPRQRLIGAGSGDSSHVSGCKAAIICRTNMGVFDAALDMMRKEITCHVDNIEAVLKDLRAAKSLYEGQGQQSSGTSVSQFDSWEELKMEAEEGDASLSRIVQLVESGRVNQIEALGRNQTDPAQSRITICTAHRSKGLEWPAVKMGPDWRPLRDMVNRHRKDAKISQTHATLAVEEWNTLYVAATRAISRVVGVDAILGIEGSEHVRRMQAGLQNRKAGYPEREVSADDRNIKAGALPDP